MNTTKRRDFFKLTILAAGGFMLKAQTEAADSTETTSFIPSPFIEVTSDGKITLTSHISEIGQGIKTSLPMLIAEELEVDWQQVNVVSKVANEDVFGRQAAGGSQSTRRNFQRLRQLGAAARETLIQAAASKWNVPTNECSATAGTIVHGTSKKSFTYAELAADASALKLPNPKSIQLKDKKDFKILGKRISGVDNDKVVKGEPLFGIDVVQPGMKYAAFLRCPTFAGEVKSANLSEVKKLPGVSNAFILKSAPNPTGGVFGGVAIIADSTWNAWKAKDALKVEWDTPDTSEHDSEKYAELAQQAIANPKPNPPKKQKGKGKGKGKNRAKAEEKEVQRIVPQDDPDAIEAIYHYPLLAHNTMEPQNCTALFKDGSFEIWAPTQSPGRATSVLNDIFKTKPNQIKIHVTRSGGGFGRRINSDFVMEAAAIAREVEGTPVKLTWTREQDIQQDYYRNACWHHFKGNVNPKGNITSFADHLVALGPDEKVAGIGGKLSNRTFPFAFLPQSQISQTVIPTNIPFGWWRAPGSNGHAFAIQCFIDELANKAGQDPVTFRRNILNTPSKTYDGKRMLGVLDAVTKRADWGKKMPAGSGQGVAFYFSHFGFVAVVAEVTVTKTGELKVDKLTAAADVGPIVNLSGAENQVQGSMLDGLSSALYQKIELVDGVVKNSNFDDYPVLRMPDAGEVDVVFVQSDVAPTGLGEPALPPTIPAVCNAIFAASGKRIRTLPISDHDLSWA